MSKHEKRRAKQRDKARKAKATSTKALATQAGLERLQPLAGQRVKGETAQAVRYCNMYLRLGQTAQGRSIRKLARILASEDEDVRGQSVDTIRSLLGKYSAIYQWQVRAETYDAQLERLKSAQEMQVLTHGIATTTGRVRQLQRLNELLLRQLEEGALYLEKTKSVKVGSRGNSEHKLVTEVQYNSKLIDDLRGLLSDVAKETGGRVSRSITAHTGLAGMLGDVPSFDKVDISQPIEDASYTDVNEEDTGSNNQ